MITDGQARRIAGEWHGGMSSDMYSFVSQGRITDGTQDEVEAEVRHFRTQPLDLRESVAVVEALRDLTALLTYLEDSGHRTPVAGWSNRWSDVPVLS
jgi:hypothetical protein